MIEKICDEIGITSNELIIKLLQEENQKLKKQQKEFIRYLEEEIEFFRTFNLESANVCKDILVYYKKIIGDDNNVKN
nr:MAG: hypothetical protein [Bacteriophage sp.]